MSDRKSRVRARKIDNSVEKDTITALIVSTEFCRDVLPMIRPSLLSIDFSSTIYEWVKNYFSMYGECPGKHIKDLYIAEKEHLQDDLSSAIGNFLAELSDKYEELETFNVDYYKERARQHFRDRALLETSEKVSALVRIGKSDLAEAELIGFKSLAVATSPWKNPFEEQYIENLFNKKKDSVGLFKLPGMLGDMLGWFKRTNFVALMGPAKRGKSWWLQAIRESALVQGLNVATISLEMEDTEVSERQYMGMSGMGEFNKDYIYPVFDCRKNQTGECHMRERASNIPILAEGESIPKFDPDSAYVECTWCRTNKPDNYRPAVWYKQENRKALSVVSVKQAVKGFQLMYGKGTWRVASYPIKTVGVLGIKRDLDFLEYSEGFVPDVIEIDYADLLQPENERMPKLEQVNDTWMFLKQLAQTKKAVVVTATQTNRKSFDAVSVKEDQIGENYRKLAHVNVMAALNQTPQEKRRGLMRLSVLLKRQGLSDSLMQTQVLQCLALGQPFLDSHVIPFDSVDEEEDSED